MSELTHIGADGKARMVDVGEKQETKRSASLNNRR
jgi:molybdenum cofactor biosynthesis enzyme